MKRLTYTDKHGAIADLTYYKIRYIFRECYSEKGVFTDNKLLAIKNISYILPCGLREAKEIVDTFIFIQKRGEWLQYIPFQHIIAGMNCELSEFMVEEYLPTITEEFMYG